MGRLFCVRDRLLLHVQVSSPARTRRPAVHPPSRPVPAYRPGPGVWGFWPPTRGRRRSPDHRPRSPTGSRRQIHIARASRGSHARAALIGAGFQGHAVQQGFLSASSASTRRVTLISNLSSWRSARFRQYAWRARINPRSSRIAGRNPLGTRTPLSRTPAIAGSGRFSPAGDIQTAGRCRCATTPRR